MLIAVRTAPGQSFINPVERVMSLLHIALYGVSLERTRMDDQYETIVGRCSSMSEIQEKAKKYHKGLEEESVAERFSRLYLKDQQFELTDLFESVKIIDPNVEMTDTTQKALSKCEQLKKFLFNLPIISAVSIDSLRCECQIFMLGLFAVFNHFPTFSACKIPSSVRFCLGLYSSYSPCWINIISRLPRSICTQFGKSK